MPLLLAVFVAGVTLAAEDRPNVLIVLAPRFTGRT